MKKEFEEIRNILTKIENCISEDRNVVAHNYNSLELPRIISEVVDFLMPILTPNETTAYFYLLKNSIIIQGNNYVRTSGKKMKNIGVSTARSGTQQNTSLSTGLINTALKGLQAKSVIERQGDTNNEGTIYRVYIPEEIEKCIELMKIGSETIKSEIDINKELDFYNVKENRLKIFKRDNYKCHYCNKQLTEFNATLDHLQPVSKGGDNSFENLTTSCLHCNSERGNKPVMDYFVEKTSNNDS